MSSLVITAQGAYRTVPGEPWRTGALALAPLVDDWTSTAPPVVTAQSLTPNTHAHVTAGHLVFTGLADRALPQLAVAPATLAARLSRPGFPAQTVTVTIPAAAALPHTAPPVAVASATIALTGRVTAAAFPHPPVPGATLSFAGVGGALVALAAPVAAGHAAGVALIARTLTAGAGTTLAAPADAGAPALILASTAGIAPGGVLRLATGEFAVADAVPGGGVVVLRLPLRTSAAAGSAVTVMTVGAAGAATTLRRACLAGDGVLLTAAAATAATVEIADGTATEYRATGAATDADGRWRLAGVRGVPELTITTAAAGFLTDGPRLHPLAPIDPTVLNTALRT